MWTDVRGAATVMLAVALLVSLLAACNGDPGARGFAPVDDGGTTGGETDLAAGPDLAAVPDLLVAPDAPAPPDLTSPPDDARPVGGSAACPVPPMTQLYPGTLPPNPYMAGPPTDACVGQVHDAIIVLGCPSNNDGTASACQTKRADIAVAFSKAGLGDWFIPTGNAVKNAFVEAESLRALLVARGVDPARILVEPKANHTDENLYYSTKIMEG